MKRASEQRDLRWSDPWALVARQAHVASAGKSARLEHLELLARLEHLELLARLEHLELLARREHLELLARWEHLESLAQSAPQEFFPRAKSRSSCRITR